MLSQTKALKERNEIEAVDEERAVPAKKEEEKKKRPSSVVPQCEIADMKDSDADDDSDDEEEKDEKKLPPWVRPEELRSALFEQQTTDPDAIFRNNEFTCDLNSIFQTKKSRYTRRTSSANWTADQLRYDEEERYRAMMGFTKGR